VAADVYTMVMLIDDAWGFKLVMAIITSRALDILLLYRIT